MPIEDFHDTFLDYVSDLREKIPKSIQDKNWWSETDSWGISLALHLYRQGMKPESSYLIEAVRCGTVKYRATENSFFSALDGALTELSMCFGEKLRIANYYHRRKSHQKYYLSPKRARSTDETNEVQYPHSAYWFHPVGLVYASALMNVPHFTPTRSEVDPFGTNILGDNMKWLETIYSDAERKNDWINNIYVNYPDWKI